MNSETGSRIEIASGGVEQEGKWMVIVKGVKFLFRWIKWFRRQMVAMVAQHYKCT